MKRFIAEANGLIWTIASTALVLITLSGSIRTWGIRISVAALVLNIIGILLSSGDDE